MPDAQSQLTQPTSSFLFASINFPNPGHIPHSLRQIKSSAQAQWEQEEGFHLLEMFAVRGLWSGLQGLSRTLFRLFPHME